MTPSDKSQVSLSYKFLSFKKKKCGPLGVGEGGLRTTFLIHSGKRKISRKDIKLENMSFQLAEKKIQELYVEMDAHEADRKQKQREIDEIESKWYSLKISVMAAELLS